MKKIILIFIFLRSFILGYEYDDVIVKAQIAVLPKLILLDKNLDKKIEKKAIITIVYDDIDFYEAIKIKELFVKSLKDKFFDFKYEIKLVNFKKLSQKGKTTAFYILKGKKREIEKVVSIAQKNHIITFCYENKDLESGVLFSLSVRNSINIYLNKRSFSKYKIKFVDILYQIVRFYQ